MPRMCGAERSSRNIPMNPSIKRKALQQMAYGLYIVGAPGEEGGCVAILANWVVQTSFSPPIIAVAIEHASAMHAAISEHHRFSVNVLPADGTEIAKGFLRSPVSASGEFNGWKYRVSAGGSPILVDSLSCLECEVRQIIESGDHTLFLGEVVEAELHREGQGLSMRETGLNYWKESP